MFLAEYLSIGICNSLISNIEIKKGTLIAKFSNHSRLTYIFYKKVQ